MVAREAPQVSIAALVFGATDPESFQELIDADRLFYLSRGALPERDLAALLESALSTSGAPAPTNVTLDRFLAADALRRIALAQNVTDLADAIRAAVVRATTADRARCILFDDARQTLWVPAGRSDVEGGESAAVGLVSFILRTGLTLCLPRAGDDPRFDRDLDDPDGNPSDRFLGVPVRAGRGEIVAVLVALRNANESPFEPLEIAAMEAVAAHCSPYLAAWIGVAEPTTGESPFRDRALRELELPVTSGLEPLRLDPRWPSRLSTLIVATLLVVLLACAFVKVPEYASGISVVRGADVVAFLPARYLTQLRPGMRLRVELAGQPYVYQWLPVASVSSEAIGPAEARRLIGRAGDAVELHGPLVVVTARVPAAHAYPGGVPSKADVRVRSERLLFVLLPSLQAFTGGGNG